MTDQTPSFIKPIPNANFGGQPTTPNEGFERPSAGVGFERLADPNQFSDIPRTVEMVEWPGGFRGELAPPTQGEFFDDFLTDEDPVNAGVRDAEPGPGQININTGSGATFKIEDGWLLQDGGSSVTAGGWWTVNNFTREPGVQFQIQLRLPDTTGGGRFGPTPNANLSATENATWTPYGSTGWARWRTNGSAIDLGDPVTPGSDREANIILRDSGQFYLLENNLSYLDQGDTFDPSYFQFNQSVSGRKADCGYLLVPTARQIPNVLASDSFNRADSATLGTTDGMGHPERHGGEGLTWVEAGSGDAQIIGGRLENASTAGVAAVIDTGQANVVVECIMRSTSASGRLSGPIARYTDFDNYLMAAIQTGNTFEITERVGGSANQIASTSVTINQDIDYRIVFVADGDSFTGILDDATVISAVSPTFLTQTKQGVFVRDNTANNGCDDFVVWPRTPTLQNYTPPQYQFIDKFTTTVDWPAMVTPRYAEPGPGTWTWTDDTAAQFWRITDNAAWPSPGLNLRTSTSTWNQLASLGDTFPRESGRLMEASYGYEEGLSGSGNTRFGLSVGNENDEVFQINANAAINIRISSSKVFAVASDAPDINDGTPQSFAQVARTTGHFYLRKVNTAWTLLYSTLLSTGDLQGVFGINGRRGALIEYNVPTEKWTPTPLASDSFDRADSSDLGSTDGAGHPEQNGGSGLAWEDISASDSGGIDIVSNQAQCISPLGSAPRYVAKAGSSVGTADVVLEASVTNGDQSGGPGLAARITDSGGVASGYVCVLIAAGSDQVLVREFTTAGGNNDIAATGFLSDSGDTNRLVMIADGDSITGVVADSTVLSAISSLNQTTQTAGFVGTRGSAGGGDKIDDFVCWPRRPTDTGPLS